MKSVPLSKGIQVKTPWLSPDEAAAYCGISRDFFDKKSAASQLPYGGTSGHKTYHVDVLDQFIRSRFLSMDNSK